MPTAVAMPCPSGPVVVSTPGVWPYSGWPGVFEPHCLKALQFVRRHALVAGQMQQRVQQHRAVTGRQHEAVAVRPGRIGGDRISGSAKTARSRHRPCPSACRDGPTWPSRPRRSRESGSRWPFRHAKPPVRPASRQEHGRSYGAPLAFHQLQDQRGENELHREIELRAVDHDRIGARHEAVGDHRQQIGKIDAARIF